MKIMKQDAKIQKLVIEVMKHVLVANSEGIWGEENRPGGKGA